MCSSAEIEFNSLPKLVRADVSGKLAFLLKAVNNVQFLHITMIDDTFLHNVQSTNQSVFPMFHNFTPASSIAPSLQILVLNQPYTYGKIEGKLRDWQCPQSVLECILLHLKGCYLNYYRGTRGEFQFARYIMQNGRFLENMAICCSYVVSLNGKLKNLKELSFCTRKSAACKLYFEW